MYNLNSSICFLGMPGCGKTWISKELGHHFEIPYFDLDAEIEIRTGMRISLFWEKYGEMCFRIEERAALLDLLTGDPLILALGGGTPCYFDNMSIVQEFSTSFYLKSSPEKLLTNIEKIRRPVFNGKSEILHQITILLKQRSTFYQRATLIQNAYLDEPNLFKDVKQICIDHHLIEYKI
ncbi:MAG: hypothetical protein IPO86_09825 [Saprospiraceae bacterium]|nr:hypothetical protein [Saprospiraceae bacterium]